MMMADFELLQKLTEQLAFMMQDRVRMMNQADSLHADLRQTRAALGEMIHHFDKHRFDATYRMDKAEEPGRIKAARAAFALDASRHDVELHSIADASAILTRGQKRTSQVLGQSFTDYGY